MLNNIKSIYFTKVIFSYLDEGIKLQIIKYNKSLKNQFNISLLNYEIFSKKYIKYESNKIGKEYNSITKKLIFEGEYLNGKRNGKGKEYQDYFGENIVVFEGEYLNGKRNGKGKEYKNEFDNNILIYEGEYSNGKRHGKGKEYYRGKLLNEIEYKNGKMWNLKQCLINNKKYELKEGKGFIKELSEDNIGFKYEGEYLNGERNGKGKEYKHYTIIYEGEFLKGKRNGKGKEYYYCKHIEDKTDNYEEDLEHFNLALLFEGEYLNGKRWNVKEYDINKNIIHEIKDGKGFIKEFDDSGRLIYEGEYLNGERHGKGKEYNNYSSESKLLFEGEYLYGKRNGKGKIYDYNGKLIFEGEFINGQKNGKGKNYNSDNEMIFDGEYLYNYKIRGKEYYKGRLQYEGEYLFDVRWNGKEYDNNGKLTKHLRDGFYDLNLDIEKEDISNEKFKKIKNVKNKHCSLF